MKFVIRAICLIVSSSFALFCQAGNPYEDWKAVHQVVSDTDDFDGDSIPALMEYYIGTSPNEPDAPDSYATIGGTASGFEFRIRQDSVVCDVTAFLSGLSREGVWERLATANRHEGQTMIHRLSAESQIDSYDLYRFQLTKGLGDHFLSGADISALSKIEEQTGTFRKSGVEGDAIELLRDAGMNMFRLRIFVDPTDRNIVVNDLEYTLELARRIRNAGAGFLLNFHYSDTWADPGKQNKPAAWENLSFAELEETVEIYTARVIKAFTDEGIIPDIVQVGNEVTAGMLWPDGQLYIGNHTVQWFRFTDLLKAGIRGVRKATPEGVVVKVMIHIDRGGDWSGTKWFFDRMLQYGVEYDIIGLSYYPWWHGPLSQVEETFRLGSERYKKPMILVETGYPHMSNAYWSAQSDMEWEISESGQAGFLRDLSNTIRNSAGGYGLGVFYWYPEAIRVPG
ncbi:MAG TPA: glycosyl hydrolase 53 family protein, partial [Oceanipulchritudo sp.]|nr:glycosyl hydrolase 53 family protein [Oceanipulchritudo sp.]